MKLRFWGTRGSIAVPGSNTVRYGGNTSCVELVSNDVVIILDCGTGVRELGLELLKTRPKPIEAHILLGHTHWDHIQGFPFFPPALAPGNRITVYSARYDKPLKEVLEGQMEYTYFPIKLGQMASDIEFRELDEDTFDIGHIQVRTQFLNHTVLTMGYRLFSGGKTVVYATDTEPFGTYHVEGNGASNGHKASPFLHEGDARFVSFVEDADVLIHDAQYTDAEYPQKVGWGHSTVEYAVEVGLAARVKHLVLFHHDPLRSDDQVAALEGYARQIVKARGADMHVSAAAEGWEIDLEEGSEMHAHSGGGIAAAPARRAKLLFADDDPEVLKLLSDCFSDESLYEIHIVQDGTAAVKAALELEPDLILLDMLMSGQDGFSVTQALRQHERLQHTPIIIVTGFANEETEAQGFRAGVTDFMRKPFAPSQLRARVQMWLHRKDQPRPIASTAS